MSFEFTYLCGVILSVLTYSIRFIYNLQIPGLLVTFEFTYHWCAHLSVVNLLVCCCELIEFWYELPPEFFCQTSFWQNDLVLLVDIES